MESNRAEIINRYRQTVKSANKELPKKEAFKDLLHRLYAGDKNVERLIDKMSLGSETTVLNIPRKDKLHRGSADTLYNKIIIEYENDLKVSLRHAKEQLAGYLLGQVNSGEGYNFTLIATDLITWKVFSPDVSQLDHLGEVNEDELILNEVTSASIILTERNTEDFYYWIDRFLFKEQKQRATLKRIEESFGYQSNVFIESYLQLTQHFNDVKKFGEVQVAYEQWKKFLSIAYGSFDGSENNFLIHTYLSLFSKMLAYAVVSNDDYIEEEELKEIINGNIFNRYNIQNFVDNDFFHWIGSDRNFRGLKKVFRIIAQEISSYGFEKVDEDILKGVYQELIDLDTRHALGEYYTPDWLCERVVNEFQFRTHDRILDPACGSGSFLRAAIHRIRALHPSVSVEDLSNNIYGIDIHPLSVQIAKTTMLLALGKDITKAKMPIHINIILANTLLAPEGVRNLFGGEFVMHIDREKLWLNTHVFEDVHLFDEALEVCEDLAEQSMNKKKETKETFKNNLNRRYKKGGLNDQLVDSFYQIYESFKLVKETGRDSIWKFIVQNLYKPYFLNKTFDYVIGNPPWFTYSSIKNEEYQILLDNLAKNYQIKPSKVANFAHLEIAAIFMSYCSSYFLKEKGKLAFVLPRSFFSGDQHDNTRSGKARGFRITQIWDLNDVSPLFRIPSGVLFVEKAQAKKSLPASGLSGISFAGNLPAHNCNLKAAMPKLTETQDKWFYIKQGKSSAFSTRKMKPQHNINPYKNLFKQGATIVPRTFFFIELTQEIPTDWEDRIINIKTSEEIQKDAKVPWKGLSHSGRIESNFIFRTALSKSILPFAIFNPDFVVLPVTIEVNSRNEKQIRLHSPKALLESGYRDAAKWFSNAENVWGQNRTEKNGDFTLEYYLNWQGKLVQQNLNSPYLVLYTSSSKDANATILERKSLELEFFADHKTYWFSTESIEEAYYLTAILNSTTPNFMMKDFQSRGLFGARDVHKKILDIYYPRFDKEDITHIKLAALGKEAHSKVTDFLKGIDPNQKVEGLRLGKIRLQINDHIRQELAEIDGLVKRIIK